MKHISTITPTCMQNTQEWDKALQIVKEARGKESQKLLNEIIEYLTDHDIDLQSTAVHEMLITIHGICYN